MGELNDADANAITWEEACDLERKLCHRPKAKKYLGANVLNINAVQRLLEVNDVPQDFVEKRNIFPI